MDFKIAGTQNGITGIQLDLKVTGINEDIIRATLKQSREARIEILRKMLTTISRPRREISATAPRLLRTKISPDKIGALIGPGGKNIRGIQESTGAVIEVDDDGTVLIASTQQGSRERQPCVQSKPVPPPSRSARSTTGRLAASRNSVPSSKSFQAATVSVTSAN